MTIIDKYCENCNKNGEEVSFSSSFFQIIHNIGAPVSKDNSVIDDCFICQTVLRRLLIDFQHVGFAVMDISSFFFFFSFFQNMSLVLCNSCV